MPQAERWSHGVRARYICGCRCDECRRANRQYARDRAKRIIFHGKDDLVAAERARAHLMMLSRSGVGRRAVSAASDVGQTILSEIRTMRKVLIRRSTETRILAVTPEALSDHALTSARQTWSQIRQLLIEGFTKAEIARRLGYKRPALQFNDHRILAANAVKVDRFYRQIMKGGALWL